MQRHLTALNEAGARIGEGHQRARISDASVEWIRDQFEAGHSYATVARALGIGIRTVRDIVAFRRRAQTPAAWKPSPARPVLIQPAVGSLGDPASNRSRRRADAPDAPTASDRALPVLPPVDACADAGSRAMAALAWTLTPPAEHE
jgi:hypothetical protein